MSGRTTIALLAAVLAGWSVAEAQNGPGRGRGRGPFTPEQREQFARHMVDRYMDRFSQVYGLDDAQRGQVRQRLEQLSAEDRATADQRHQQMEAVRQQMHDLRTRRDAGEQIDPQQWSALSDQMRTIMGSAALMNRERVTGEIEKLLPPQQAAAGHERLAQQSAEEDRRREEMRQRWQAWRDQGGDPRGFWRQRRGQDAGSQPQSDAGQQPEAAPADASGNAGAQDQQGQHQRHGGRGYRWGDTRRRGWQPGDDRITGEFPRGGTRRGAFRDTGPLGSWELYVREFCRRYQLDAAQQKVAQSILRDLLAQRKAYEDEHRGQLEAAQKIEDHELRRQQLEFVNGPVVRLFEQLKSKLQQIPTAAQREAAGPETATTQPAAPDRGRGQRRAAEAPAE